MPSFHISSSGKLVQCKNDPCKLHAGSDFQAKNLKEAQKIAEKATKSNNISESLTKNFDNLPENVQTYAQNYYNKLVEKRKTMLKIMRDYNYYGPTSDEVGKLDKHYEKLENDTKIANDRLFAEMLDETSKSQYEPYYRHKDLKNVDTSNKMPESFKQAVANLNVEAKNGRFVPHGDDKLSQNVAFNKFTEEVGKILDI